MFINFRRGVNTSGNSTSIPIGKDIGFEQVIQFANTNLSHGHTFLLSKLYFRFVKNRFWDKLQLQIFFINFLSYINKKI